MAVSGGEVYVGARDDVVYGDVDQRVADDEAALEHSVLVEERLALPVAAVVAVQLVAVFLSPLVFPVLPSLSFLCIGCSLSFVVAAAVVVQL